MINARCAGHYNLIPHKALGFDTGPVPMNTLHPDSWSRCTTIQFTDPMAKLTGGTELTLGYISPHYPLACFECRGDPPSSLRWGGFEGLLPPPSRAVSEEEGVELCGLVDASSPDRNPPPSRPAGPAKHAPSRTRRRRPRASSAPLRTWGPQAWAGPAKRAPSRTRLLRPCVSCAILVPLRALAWPQTHRRSPPSHRTLLRLNLRLHRRSSPLLLPLRGRLGELGGEATASQAPPSAAPLS